MCDSGKKQIEITDAMKQKFLDAHNEKRNGIASGSVSGFGPATRMATVVWSDEMAALAVLNTKQCEMEHDKCRATGIFLLNQIM